MPLPIMDYSHDALDPVVPSRNDTVRASTENLGKRLLWINGEVELSDGRKVAFKGICFPWIISCLLPFSHTDDEIYQPDYLRKNK